MYRKRFIAPRKGAEVEHYESQSYRPFSYYVLGGCDITGEHTALTNPTLHDNPEEVPDFSAPNALTSPRCGIMELTELLGAKKAQNAKDKSKAGEKTE